MKIQHFMALVVLSLPTVPGARAFPPAPDAVTQPADQLTPGGNDVKLTVVTPVPIALSAAQRFGTQFEFSYLADLGLRYAVERSVTWSNWTTIRTDTANVNPMTFTDTAATNRMNFYRVRLLPNP